MKKVLYFSALMLAAISSAKECNALLKVDVPNTAQSAVTAVSNYAENFTKIYDNISTSSFIKTIGDGVEAAKSTYNLYNENKEKMEEFRENPLQSSLNLAEGEDKNEQNSEQTDEGEPPSEESGNGGDDKFSSKFDEKVNAVKDAADLEDKQETLLKSINDAKDAKRAEVENKIKVLEENNAQLAKEIEDNPSRKEELTKQIEANNAKIKAYQAGLAASEAEVTAEDMEELADVQNSLSALQAKIEAWANEQAEKVMEDLKKKLASNNTEDDLKQNTENNFLANNEPEDAANIIEKRNYRKQAAGNGAIETIAQTAVIKRELDDDKTFTQNVADRTDAVDGSLPANITDTQATIMVVQEMAKMIRLKIMDLKLKSAQEMAQYEKTSSEPDMDITKFTLEKYVCEPQSSGE